MTPPHAERETGRALRLLILGGTTEASGLARTLAGRGDVAPLLSFAGRTEDLVQPPIPHRVGGFGGTDGLTAFLHAEAIDALIDATHPFAARISANAAAACRRADVPLAVYTRPAWTAVEGDDWCRVPDIGTAIAVLESLDGCDASPTPFILSRVRSTRVEGRTIHQQPLLGEKRGGMVRPSTQPPRGWLRMTERGAGPFRVFLTTGRMDLGRFLAAPQHQYLIRTIDPPTRSDLPPNATVLLARPPFTMESEIALMQAHGIDLLVTKNSGGHASAAKLAAARRLGVPVLMVERPLASGALEVRSLDAVLAWIAAQRTRS